MDTARVCAYVLDEPVGLSMPAPEDQLSPSRGRNGQAATR